MAPAVELKSPPVEIGNAMENKRRPVDGNDEVPANQPANRGRWVSGRAEYKGPFALLPLKVAVADFPALEGIARLVRTQMACSVGPDFQAIDPDAILSAVVGLPFPDKIGLRRMRTTDLAHGE